MYETPLGILANIEYPVNEWTDQNHMNQLDTAWIEVSECTGLNYLPDRSLIIEYATEVLSNKGDAKGGFFYVVPEYAYIRVVLSDLRRGQFQYTKHEFIHYLLWMNGISKKDNFQHNSPFFDQCS